MHRPTTHPTRVGALLIVMCTAAVTACSDDKAATNTTTTTTTAETSTSARATSTTVASSSTTAAGSSDDLAGFEPTASTLPPSEARGSFAGFWTGDWGDLVLRVDADGQVVGAYTHDEGEIVGRIGTDGMLVGWWCESPSRQPNSDAGTVEMRLIAGASGAAIDGRWSYAEHQSGATWRDDWDIAAKSADAAPAALTARLDQVAAECIPPSATGTTTTAAG